MNRFRKLPMCGKFRRVDGHKTAHFCLSHRANCITHGALAKAIRLGTSLAEHSLLYNTNDMNTLEMMDPVKNQTRNKDTVVLPYGLLGFERVKNYSLLTNPAEDPFLWFQMKDDARLAFVVVPPELVLPTYQPDIEEEDVEFLGLEDPSDAFILSTVTVRGARQATVNLKGPIIINRRTWIGKQVIPANAAQFSLRHPLSVC